jgi:solute carrier family 35 protein F5
MEGTQPFWARAFPMHEPRKLLGLVFVVAVAIIWVGASFVVQGIEEQGAHPVVLTFVANSLFAVYVPIYYLNLRWRRRRQQHAAAAALAAARQQQEHEGSALVPEAALRSDEGDTLPSPLHADGLDYAVSEGNGVLLGEDSQNGKGGAEPPAMPLRQLFRAALLVAPLWYLAQFTFNSSLSMTSVTSNTILSSTSALFTFLFAVVLLAEAFTLWKLAFILLLIVGTTMVTVADGMYSTDRAAAKESVLGDMLCLLSAVLYGSYTVSIRWVLTSGCGCCIRRSCSGMLGWPWLTG